MNNDVEMLQEAYGKHVIPTFPTPELSVWRNKIHCPNCAEKITKTHIGMHKQGWEAVTTYCDKCKKIYTLQDITADIPNPDDLDWEQR